MKQTIASDCAITGVCSALGGALLGVAGAGLLISSMGVLSASGGGPVQVDSDMNSSHMFNISNVKSSYLRCIILTCTDYSNFGGWKNQIHNISNNNSTNDSGSYARLYGRWLCYNDKCQYIIFKL